MANFFYVNGQILPEEKVGVQVKDRGLMYGDGVFETMRTYNGRVFRLEQRIDRLLQGLQTLKFAILPEADALTEAVETVISENAWTDARIKIIVTRGVSESVTPQDASPTVVVTGSPINPPVSTDPWTAAIVNFRRDEASPLSRIKSLNYLPSVLGLLEAKEKGADEGILLNYKGSVAEGTMSNLFIVKSGKLITPEISSGALPGITRSTVIEVALKAGMECEERDIKPDELLQADEAFATNSVIEIKPVISVDGQPIASGVPGPITQMIAKGYGELIRHEA